MINPEDAMNEQKQWPTGFIVVLCLIIGLITLLRTKGPTGSPQPSGSTVPQDSAITGTVMPPTTGPNQH
jgi:hypothetical protein